MIRAIAALAALLAMGCREGGGLAGGSGSQTTNTLTGTLVDGKGRTMAGARVRLIPAGLDPVADSATVASLADTTDALGRYRIAGIADGEYALEADRGSERACFAALGLKLSGARSFMRASDTMRSPGSLSVRLDSRGSLGGYLYVPGTTYCVRMAPTGDAVREVRLESLPPGIYPTVILAPALGPREEVAGAPFTIRPGAVTPAGAFAGRGASWPITLRAGADGAGLRSGVRDFPLLVRLDSAFDFSRVRVHGADLRAMDAEGRPLPLDIERWDSAGRKAEVWIMLDTVPDGAAFGAWLYEPYAGDSGIAEAAGPAFDTAAGFAGVWHLQRLDRGASDTTTWVPDATPWGTRGLARNGAGSAFAEGPLGRAMLFDGVDDFLDLGNGAALDVGATLTLEAWIRPDRMPRTGTGFDDAMVIARFDAWSLELQADGAAEAWARTGPEKTPQTLRAATPSARAGTWTHFAAVYDGRAFRLYVDGVEAASGPAEGAVNPGSLHALVGFIEGWGDVDRFFAGAIDEVRVSRIARKPEWLRLGRETQRPGNGNVTVGRPVQ